MDFFRIIYFFLYFLLSWSDGKTSFCIYYQHWKLPVKLVGLKSGRLGKQTHERSFRDLSRSYRTHARGLRRSSRVLRRSIDADSFSTQPLAQALENHPVCLSRFDLFPRLSPTQLSVETKESNKNSRDFRGILNISFEIPQIRSP